MATAPWSHFGGIKRTKHVWGLQRQAAGKDLHATQRASRSSSDCTACGSAHEGSSAALSVHIHCLLRPTLLVGTLPVCGLWRNQIHLQLMVTRPSAMPCFRNPPVTPIRYLPEPLILCIRSVLLPGRGERESQINNNTVNGKSLLVTWGLRSLGKGLDNPVYNFNQEQI